jgi:hypothetical protein
MLAYVFALPSPGSAPVLTLPLSEDDRALVARYALSVVDLGESSLFNVAQRFTHGESHGTEVIHHAEFLNREGSRGVAVTFRQLHSTKERASFDKICSALFKHLKSEPAEVRDQGQQVVARWREAHNKLQGHSLNQLTRKKMIEEKMIGGEYVAYAHELPPQDLLSLYLYGDYIHWDGKRVELAEAAKDPVMEGMLRMNFMEAMLVFGHIYLGFANVIWAMTGAGRGRS